MVISQYRERGDALVTEAENKLRSALAQGSTTKYILTNAKERFRTYLGFLVRIFNRGPCMHSGLYLDISQSIKVVGEMDQRNAKLWLKLHPAVPVRTKPISR